MITAHEVQDENKVAEIAKSMTENGWIGAPIVCFDDIQITGVHRVRGAEEAGIEIETIQLEDIFAEDGADWDEAVAAYQSNPSVYPHSAIADEMLPLLSKEIKAKYGIDLE